MNFHDINWIANGELFAIMIVNQLTPPGKFQLNPEFIPRARLRHLPRFSLDNSVTVRIRQINIEPFLAVSAAVLYFLSAWREVDKKRNVSPPGKFGESRNV